MSPDSDTVAVIGGGVAGLVSARVLLEDGFDVSVFEREPEIGGVWVRSRAYPGLRTNNPCDTYAFSDFEHAADSDEFPTAAQVRAYLERYTDHFGLRPRLRLSTEVIEVARSGPAGGPFRVTTRPVDDPSAAGVEEFDFVVVCNGVFSQPAMPSFAGASSFSGGILHSSQLAEAESLEGQDVVVIGSGKSALDCATFASREAASCTLLFRQPHWMLPRYFGRRRVDRQVMTRLSELLTFPAFHSLSTSERALRWLARPLTPLLERLRRKQRNQLLHYCRVPEAMRAQGPIHEHVCHLGIGTDCYEAVRDGRIEVRNGTIEAFAGKNLIRLDSGEIITADRVICATGWRQGVDFLSAELQHAVCPDGRFRLYRHILPPQERRLGFVGYAASTNTPLTAEMAAHWLSESFLGGLRLPSPDAMERDVERVDKWIRANFPKQREGYFIGGYVAHYVDWLLRDLGLPTRRSASLKEEYLGPVWASRYRGIAGARRKARSTAATPRVTAG